ncbi:hypothetical protein [Inquilinus limosus]|uniref:Uncharacterized protein n=1 Tax=Inquilinus limosus MP06 TaxID=1398085 RepID=A0A0A0D7B2_9PROT|nr:hypothetical protein [Inquilinus limosus]KGM33975.1 hypothetical protein P409_12880 [Inquilinus limosus MP06]
MSRLDISKICDRIAVQTPYFAFGELQGLSSGAVRGVFASEQTNGYERGPIASAEVGRHLAILGSCAAVAGQATERIYYLATKARFSTLDGAQPREAGRIFEATAETVSHDRRSLKAQAIVSDGRPFAHLHCDYQALPERVFQRLFQEYRAAEVPPAEESPYREPIPLEFDAPQALSLTARSQPLAPARCAGHFPGYPAWPVAIIAETIAQVVSRLLHHILGKETDYSVVRTDIAALKLVSAATPLSFLVDCLSASRTLSHYVFSARVMWGEEIVATLDTELRV